MRAVSRVIETGARLSATVAALASAMPAVAWTRPGHMVTAAIAYDELRARNPKILDKLIGLLDHHPDRGAFEVAGGRSTAGERAQRLFFECARWPDDARGTAYDHPSWHTALRPTVSRTAPPATIPSDEIAGDAVDAFALQLHVLANTAASDAERAVALCWVMHLAGDVHQPLHTAQLYSKDFPTGDKAGSLQYVRESTADTPITLHWFWDDSVNRLDALDAVQARSVALQRKWPRASLPELSKRTSGDFAAWMRESYPVARDVAYGPDLKAGPSETAPVVGLRYRTATTLIAERRLTLAGYRIADLLQKTLGDN